MDACFRKRKATLAACPAMVPTRLPSILPLIVGVALGLVAAGCGDAVRPVGASDARSATVVTAVAAPSALPPGRPPAASYAPWPAAGHDARHTGSAPVVGPQDGSIRWKRKLEGAVVPGPIVGRGGVVFAASNGGVLHALDPATGRDRWSLDGGGPYGSDLTTSPLLLPSGLLLWPGPGDALIAVEARDGRERWRLALGAPGLSPVLGPDGTVYVADTGGGLRAVDVSGDRPRVRWRLTLGAGGSYTSPSVDRRDGVTTIYGGVGQSVVAVRDDGTRGTVTWTAATRGLVETSTAVGADGTVVAGSNDKRLHAFAPDGTPRWTARLESLTYSSPAAAVDGTFVVGDHRGAISRLAADDGRLVARHVGIPQTPRRRSVGIWTAPAIDARGAVYFGSRLGHIYGFAYDGRKLLDVATGATVDSNPALGPDGTLYIGSEDGFLYAIGPGG